MADWLGPSGLYISDLDGSSKVYLTGVSTPYPIPEPTGEYGVDLQEMDEGSAGRGHRVALLTGITEEFDDYEFSLTIMSDAQLTALSLKYRAQPAVPVQLSFDNGTTRFVAVFAKDGFLTNRYEQNWKRRKAKIKLHVLKRMS